MNIQKNKGYSIAEIIIYLAIFTAISIAVINSFIVIVGSFNTTRTYRDLLESGSVSMERISREIRQAQSVNLANSTFGSNPGVLELNTTDASGNVITISFHISNNALNIYQNGVLVGNLLGQNISANSLIFRHIVTTNGEAIKVELTLQDTNSKTNQSANFYDTIILRGSY